VYAFGRRAGHGVTPFDRRQSRWHENPLAALPLIDESLFNALYDADPNSKDVQDILSMFAMLDQSCPD
jgi:hypothetical protein